MNTLNKNDKIKLVIFDLDETLWDGVLSSEEEIVVKPYNINVIKELVNRGIMCSISSKNDFNVAKKKLEELKIWDLFIFPSINWNSKGQQIKQLITDANLRDENVLFIDDNKTNLEEARYYSPKIKVATPEIFNEILCLPALTGKDDTQHSRLKPYKILEKKQLEAKKFNDDTEFLRKSNIRISISDITPDLISRTIELIQRTNQLNFTKKRIDEDELSNLLKNSDYENKIVNVNDKYGDYGICGYYCLNKKTNVLEHFVFSCRIMNLKVEQYIYAKLGFPSINIVEPVSFTLNNFEVPDFIKISSNIPQITQKKDKKIKVLLLGNCDMQAISHYTMGTSKDIEVNFYIDINPITHMQVRYDSIWKMKNAKNLSCEEKKELLKVHKWLCENSFKNRALFDDYDILAFSVLNDYMVPIYEDKNTHITLTPTTSYEHNIFTAPIDVVLDLFNKNQIINFSEEEVIKMQANLIEKGYMSDEDFKNNLEWLITNVNKPIIFLNGPEVLRPDTSTDLYERFIRYNKVLDEFVKKNKNCYLLDVRKYIKTANDTTDVVTHYHRQTYIHLAEDLFHLLTKKNHAIKYLIYLKIIRNNLKKLSTKLQETRKQIIKVRFGTNAYLILFGKTIYKHPKNPCDHRENKSL